MLVELTLSRIWWLGSGKGRLWSRLGLGLGVGIVSLALSMMMLMKFRVALQGHGQCQSMIVSAPIYEKDL